MKAMKILTVVAIAAGVTAPAWGGEFATKDEAVAMVNKAVTLFKKEGAEKAYAEFDKKPGDFTDRDLYVLVYSTNGKVLAHGASPKLIGKDMSEAQDVDGKYYVKERMALAAKQKTFWQDYKFVNPVTKKIEPKEAYCDVEGETIICSGVYKQ
ncbi:MAG TPA: cache domain-containing protein [Xanthobacteraceae bacterium]|nr:cache domain-containing protein [Xanthobacteraceae bacterium]